MRRTTQILKVKWRRYLESAGLSWTLGALTFAGSISRLAQTPQTGDGAELVLTAVGGGILHPPGFPLQAWLQRVFLWVPWGTPAARISLLSLVAHAVTVALVCETGRALGHGVAARVITALLFATSLSVWYLGLQPEVFSLAYALIAGLYLASARMLVEGAKPRPRPLLVFGTLLGLGLSQHPLVVLSLPCFLAVAYLLVRKTRGRRRWAATDFAALLVPAALIPLALYLSLPLLSSGLFWPNWGKLDSLSAVFHHVVRKEYGVFSLSSHTGERPFSGLGLLLADLLEDWSWLCLLLVPGFVSVFKRRQSGVGLVVLSGLLLALIFLWRASVVNLNYYAESILARFLGVAVLPLALLFGIGIHTLESLLPSRRSRIAVLTALGALVAARIPSHARIVDLSRNDNVETIRAAFFESIPPQVVHFAGSDIEAFYGVLDEKTRQTHFSITPGLLGLSWYRERMVPRWAPGFPIPAEWDPGTTRALVEYLWRQGKGVAILEPQSLGISPKNVERRGLLNVAWGPFGAFSRESSLSVGALCKHVRRLRAAPRHGRAIDKAVHDLFTDAFLDAARFHRAKDEKLLAEKFWAVALALSEGTDPAQWGAHCDSLERELHAAP